MPNPTQSQVDPANPHEHSMIRNATTMHLPDALLKPREHHDLAADVFVDLLGNQLVFLHTDPLINSDTASLTAFISQKLQRNTNKTIFIVRSGPLAPSDGHSLAWLPSTRNTFFEFCSRLSELVDSDIQLVVWPHAHGVISDAPSLHSFLRQFENWMFVFDPSAMMAASMAATATDHLDRLFDAFSNHPRAVAAARYQSQIPDSRWQGCGLPVWHFDQT